MITKLDCILLLTNLQKQNIDVSAELNKLATSSTIPLSSLKLINDNRQLDVTEFYEYLRKSYNNKKSKLYINIVKEIDQPTEVITTLSALLTQIVLYSNKVENKELFLKHARADEISLVLYKYFTTGDIRNALNLLRLIKADLKALESLKK